MAAKERTKENCRCFDAADPRLRGCTPLRTPKRKSKGAGAKRTQYYCPFLTPPPLPPLFESGVPPNPRCRKQQSVGAGHARPATLLCHSPTGNLRPLQRGGLPPSLAPPARHPFTPPRRGRACPARSLAIAAPLSFCIVGRGLDPSAGRRGRRPLHPWPQTFRQP